MSESGGLRMLKIVHELRGETGVIEFSWILVHYGC